MREAVERLGEEDPGAAGLPLVPVAETSPTCRVRSSGARPKAKESHLAPIAAVDAERKARIFT